MLLLLLACTPYHPPARTPPLTAARGPVATLPVSGEELQVAIRAGSAFDPPGREGLAAVTAAALALRAGASVSLTREVVVFRVPVARGDALYAALAAPPDAEDVTAVKASPPPASSCVNLAYDALDAWLYAGNPYGRPDMRASVLPTITAAEAAGFHRLRYVRGATIVGLPAGAPTPPADFLPPALSRPATPAPLDRGAPVADLLVVEAPGIGGACLAVGHHLDTLDETGRAALALARASWSEQVWRPLGVEASAVLARDLPNASRAAADAAAVAFAELATVGLADAELPAAKAGVAAAEVGPGADPLERALLGLPAAVDPQDLDAAAVSAALRGLLRPTLARTVIVTPDASPFRDAEGKPLPGVELASAEELSR